MYGAREEYALHTLLNLYWAGEDAAPSARELADFQKLPVAYLRKVMSSMEQAGLVVATEGRRGGWRFATAPERITVLMVADAVAGRQRLFECQEIRARCALWPDDAPPAGAQRGTCAIHAVMLEAEAALRGSLGARTIADIALEVSAKTSSVTREGYRAWFTQRVGTRARGEGQ